MAKLFGRDLSNTAFSVDRLFIWAVGVVLIIGMITMAILAVQGKTIAPQIQSAVMICLGCFIARIERKK